MWGLPLSNGGAGAYSIASWIRCAAVGPNSSAATASPKSIPAVTIGRATGRIDFSALSPGFIGLYQVNVGIPSDAPTGTQTLTLTIGGQSVTKDIPIQ